MITHEIIGDDMQAVVLTMARGDVVRAEAGAMMYMTDGINMDAKMTGGLLGGLKRKLLAGESLFLTYFECQAGQAASRSRGRTGKIDPVELKGQELMCQRDAFLCAVGEIDIDIALTRRLGAGFFGGEGFILEKIKGNGTVFVHSGGTVVPIVLAAGEKLKVDTGCLVAFDPTVDYDIQTVAGIKTALFGGEGLFFAAMAGPGRVWLQTLPFSRLADRIHHAYRRDVEDTKRDLGGVLGGLGDLIGGDRR
jgi:uncharacterized protein (TIGR00266 family)